MPPGDPCERHTEDLGQPERGHHGRLDAASDAAPLQHEMFASLRRWLGIDTPREALPLDFTIAAMDEEGLSIGLVAEWAREQNGHVTGVCRRIVRLPAGRGMT